MNKNYAKIYRDRIFNKNIDPKIDEQYQDVSIARTERTDLNFDDVKEKHTVNWILLLLILYIAYETNQ